MLTIEEIPGVLVSLQERLRAKEKERWISLSALCSTDRTWSLHMSVAGISKVFRGKTLDEAVAAMSKWLDRDDVALTNLTLGLTAEGTLP